MGRHRLGRNDERQAAVYFAKKMGLAITDTFFVKKQAHKITYNSGGRKAKVDYVIVRRRKIKEVVDAKVVAGECVATQHRMVVSTMIVRTKWRRASKAVKKITKLGETSRYGVLDLDEAGEKIRSMDGVCVKKKKHSG